MSILKLPKGPTKFPRSTLIKKTSFLFAAGLFLLGSALQAETGKYRSIRIQYEKTFQPIKMDESLDSRFFQTETLLIDFKNIRRRLEQDFTITQKKTSQRQKRIQIMDEKKVVTLNPVNKVATVLAHRMKDPPILWDAQPNEDNFIRKDAILGKPCRVYEHLGRTLWFWNGLILKEELDKGPIQQVRVAKKIEVNVDVPRRLFKIPKGYTKEKIKTPTITPRNDPFSLNESE